MKYLILAGLFVFAASCSSSDKPAVYSSDAGSSGAHAGSSGRAGVGGGQVGTAAEGGEAGRAGEAGSANGSTIAPVVTIETPMEVTDPNVGPVLIDDQITVLCSATQSKAAGSTPINPSSVKIAMFDAAGASLKSVAGVPTSNVDEYSAAFVLTSVTNGAVSFQCAADDTSTPVNHASVTANTFVDRGPTIAIVAPVKDSAHSIAPVDFQFTVAAAPLNASDAQAAVGSVTLEVGGVVIDVTNNGAGTYRGSVNFSDKTLYPSPPTGTIPVTITAKNKRIAPGNAADTLSYSFVLDGVGPVVSFSSPAEGAVIGRTSILAFTIVDPGSGVDNQTVEVKLNTSSYLYSATDGLWTWSSATGAYTFQMGSQLASNTTDTQVTVNVNVADNAGNTSTGNSRGFKLDNQPPTLDLDPPVVYLTRPGSAANTLQCSDYFDPVGAAAPNDLSTITNFGLFRALVWDQTNSSPGQTIFTFALTDKSSVRLYVQPDPSKPLLHYEGPNAGPNKTCNEIWTGSPPEQKNADDKPLQFVALTALTPTGAANWGVSSNPPTNPICEAGANSSAPRLCGNSDMTLVLEHPAVVTPREPVIYAYQPDTSPSSPKCTGDQWEVSSAIASMGATQLGWMCMAVRAVDTVGNPGISAPLRVCLDDGTNPTRCKNLPAPTCVDNCVAPGHFSVPSGSQN